MLIDSNRNQIGNKIQKFAVKHALDKSSPNAIQDNLLKCFEYMDSLKFKQNFDHGGMLMGWMGEWIGSAAAAFVKTKAKLDQQDKVVDFGPEGTQQFMAAQILPGGVDKVLG